MRLLIQRVKEAKVVVDGKICGQIGKGVLLFLGIHKEDVSAASEWLVKKVVGLRIFRDMQGKMNLDIRQAEGDFLVVSQCTLYGNCLSGKRPDFVDAAPPEKALQLYQCFVHQLEQELGKTVQTGKFGAEMEVILTNDGPVTFFLER